MDLLNIEQRSPDILLDLAAIQTMFNGGTVYAVAPETVPDAGDLAAIFRF